MGEIAMAGDPGQCRTDGRILVRKGFVTASEKTSGDGRNYGRGMSVSILPSPRKAAEEGARAGLEAASRGAETQTAKAGVSPEAAEALIVHKRIGERIKSLRQRKHMGLVELGRYTGLSASFLSQLETGRVVPTLRNLSRIAMVFSRDLSYFFEPEQPELFRILRASERQRQPQTGADKPDYFFESLGPVSAEQTIAPYLAEFLASGERRSPAEHQHPGAEFLYLLSGRLRLMHQGRAETLEMGDAVYFDPSAKHSYERLGDEPCSALILTMPEPLNNGSAASKSVTSIQNGWSNATGTGGRQR